MKEKLLLQVELNPIRIEYGSKGGTRIMSLNQVIPMNHHKLNRIHTDFIKSYRKIIRAAYKKNAFYHENEATYTVSLGYKHGHVQKNGSKVGRKPPRVDLDNIGAWIGKVATDALIKETPIPDDDCRTITEVRYKYLGEADKEHLILQLTKNLHDKED